ncbi:hypothetical protein [Terracidiphilus sp.]|jgi:hypothetical protein|uniref:hypothetical protein n=1 Tax=Terracidiphilus sp. TaxID=1964191 RepID=UPI003C2591C2
MGILAPLTRYTLKDIAGERERFQELLELRRQFSGEALQQMHGYVRELEVRISDLPGGGRVGLDSRQIAKTLRESTQAPRHSNAIASQAPIPALVLERDHLNRNFKRSIEICKC